MVKIKINGSWVTEERDIKNGVVQVFHSFLSKIEEWRPRCNGLQVGLREGEDAAMLEAPFSEEEVFGALSYLNGDKAPSPNVSQWRFGGAEDLKDFKSISLVGSLYKLLAKVLANKLKNVMAMLRLKVNLDKSEIISVGRVENVEDLTLEFGCKVSTLPSSYFGFPLGARFQEVAVWDGYAYLLYVPILYAKEYEFEIGADPKGFSLDKRKGGLGVRNLALLDKALLCKWSWRFVMEREALWRQVICVKYEEEEGGWRSCVVRGGLDFGKTSGVETIFCVFLFPFYSLYPWLRRLGWRMCGAILEGKCGLLVLPDSSLAAAVVTAPFDPGFDPRQRCHLIRAQLVSQLIRVQLVLLD
ncbi:hypothetical protein CK203_068199 [Vitis vinifera]|uniref:Uncharacterized protein n=1 Tax=Vitis vinifera TaxID=29760 RepID=A0A438E1I0_VITVI|nr:hypothetical protein CK203_068199 [Vitis vinifera]